MSGFDILRSAPDPTLVAVVEEARGLGPGRAYLVGGWVRDRLLGRQPADLDVTVVGDGPAFAARLAQRLTGRLIRHEIFGTAEVTVDGGPRIDVATARRETYPTPGTLPRVEAAGLAEDLGRRDFTVNAMAVDAAAGAGAEVVDPFSGREALQAGRLRPIHERSFVDDPTRLLRGVELESRLGFRLQEGTAERVRAAMEAGAFAAVSTSRRRQAWDRLVRDGRSLAVKARRLEDFAVFEAWVPGAVWSDRLDAALARLERGLEDETEPGDAMPGTAALAVVAVTCDAAHAISRFSRGGGEAHDLATWPARARSLEAVLSKALTPHVAVEALAPLEEWQRLALTASEDPVVRRRVLRYAREWRHLSLSVSGADLVARGCPPGPRIGEALRRVRAARLDGLIGRSEELEYAVGWLARRNEP